MQREGTCSAPSPSSSLEASSFPSSILTSIKDAEEEEQTEAGEGGGMDEPRVWRRRGGEGTAAGGGAWGHSRPTIQVQKRALLCVCVCVYAGMSEWKWEMAVLVSA